MVKTIFTYHIGVFGCQMNYADAEIIAAIMSEKGGRKTDDVTKANLIVVVTCAVRSSAEERVVSWIKKAKRQNSEAAIIMTGCLSHRQDIAKRLWDVVDLFIPIEHWGAREKEIFTLLQGKNASQVLSCSFLPKTTGSGKFYGTLPQYANSYRAYIPIMTGCDNFCAYCVVPYARGREKSRSPESILREVKRLIKKGYKEIYLLGQNVNSYKGIDKKNIGWNFAQLLKAIDAIPGDFWVRFISCHPKDVTPEFIETYASCQKVSPNLHLPLQSGSDRILRAMNRKYTRKKYLDLVSLIQRHIPQVVLSTDIIVGFPGETAKDFRDSLDIVKKSGFEMLFSLKFSPRPETAACKMKNDVDAETKIARQRKLDETWKAIALVKNARFIGKKIKILVDRVKVKAGKSDKPSIYALGKSFENKDVRFPVDGKNAHNLIGRWAIVQVKKAGALALEGKLVKVK